VTERVTVSPAFTESTGPGRVGVTAAQSPAVAVRPNPQIGTTTLSAIVAVPVVAHKLMDTGAAEATEPVTPSPAATRISTSAARFVMFPACTRIAGFSLSSPPVMARHR
jgi:hypothetical protein